MLGAVLLPGACRAVTRMAAHAGTETARIVLTWPEVVTADARIDGRELYLSFDRVLGDPDADVLASLRPAWIDWVQFGHSSLLIHASRDVVYSVATEGRDVEILMRAAEAPPDEGLEAERAAAMETRLRCLRGATRLATWDLDGAEEILDEVLGREPGNLTALLLMADSAARQEHWHRAVAYYDRALALENPHPDVSRARGRLWRERGDGLQVASFARSISNAESRVVTSLQGRLLTRDEMTVTARARTVRAELDDLLRADGRIASYDATSAYGELSADWRGRGITRTRLRLHLGPAGVGAGVAHRMGEPRSTTEIAYDVGEPYLEYVQGLADEGVRDRLELTHQRRLRERWTLRLGLSDNRYGLGDLDTVARSVGIRGGLGYTFARGATDMHVEYVLDVERIGRLDAALDGAGVEYHPLQLLDRQAHTVAGSVCRSLFRIVHGAVVAGYSHDPEHGRGTFGELNLSYDPDARVGVTFRASFGLNMQRSDSARYREIGGTVRWSF